MAQLHANLPYQKHCHGPYATLCLLDVEVFGQKIISWRYFAVRFGVYCTNCTCTLLFISYLWYGKCEGLQQHV